MYISRVVGQSTGCRLNQGYRMLNSKFLLTLSTICVFAATTGLADESDDVRLGEYRRQVMPVLKQFCADCHRGAGAEAGVKIEELNPDLVKGDDGEHWEEVLNQLNTGEMPPEDEPQPTDKQREVLTAWVTSALKHAAEVRRSTGGRNVLRRLTRYEYNNTLRDLLGIDLDFAKDLPPEGAAQDGFKNNNAVLITSSLHLDYFQRIARSALTKALVFGDRPEPVKLKFEPEVSSIESPKKKKNKRKRDNEPKGVTKVEDGAVLDASGNLQFKFNGVPTEGPVRLRVKAGAIASGSWSPQMLIELGNDAGSSARPTKTLASLTVDAPRDSPQWYEFEFRAEDFPLQTISRTKQQFLAISNSFDPGTSRIGQEELPKLFVDSVEITGPYYETWPPETRTRILIPSEHKDDESRYSRDVIERFMARAYRRPPRAAEVQRMQTLFLELRSRRSSFEDSIVGTLSAVLCAPSFLLIAEPSPAENAEPQVRPLDDYELASRLSYFLWSTMPDEELFDLADRQQLRNPDVLMRQVERMLRDSRSEQFVEHFTTQWLDLDSIYRVAVNPEFFPKFREGLKDVMREETVQFFGTVLQDDLSCLAMLDSDFAMLNSELARHYGIDGVAGTEIRKVPLKPDQNRGGILTHGSILLGNSSGDDTHPVKRGVWLLERVLGDPPPPPPPAVPTLAEGNTKGQRLSLKQKLLAHREEAACMNCHRRIDPWGVAFENYDGVGTWRPTTVPVSVLEESALAEATTEKQKQKKPSDSTADADGGWPTKQLPAASIQISEDDSSAVRKLKAAVNSSLTSLQRPYNHLRRLGPEGPADQHRRFLGYIELRTPVFDAAVAALIRETGDDRATFMESLVAANQEVMDSNRLVQKLAEQASPESAAPSAKQRDKKRKTSPKSLAVEVDPRTTLPDDTAINSLRDLKAYLLEHRKDQFAESLVRRTLSYSLGRYLDFTDTPTVRELTSQFQQDGYRMSGLVKNVVLSEAFLTK